MSIEALDMSDFEQADFALDAEVRKEQNILDLIELFETEEFSDAQRAFTTRALEGHMVRVEELRRKEFAVLALTRDEFSDFLSHIPELKNTIVDTLAGVGVVSGWRREQRRGIIGYQLLLGSKPKPEVEFEDAPNRERIIFPPPSADADLAEFIAYYRPAIRRIAEILTRQHPSNQFSQEDLVQEVSLGLTKSFEISGPEVFNYIDCMARNKLVDLLRGSSPLPRSHYTAVKIARLVRDEGLGKEEAQESIRRRYPAIEAGQIEFILADVFGGVAHKPIVSLEALQRDYEKPFDVPSTYNAPDTLVDTRPREEILTEFFDKFLHNERWDTYKTARLKKVARLIFVEGWIMNDMAPEFGVSESRISQMRTEAILAIKANLIEAGVGGDEAAEIMGVS